jgi:hypothetical protein
MLLFGSHDVDMFLIGWKSTGSHDSMMTIAILIIALIIMVIGWKIKGGF